MKQDGLEWVQEVFSFEPRWIKEPKIEVIEKLARKHLALDHETPCKVQFHAQGAFNKLYKVHCKDSNFLMRITLPVDPYYKTSSEVATIKFVSQKTDIPVPKIFAFDESNKNELGFEWILLEMMPGRPLRSRWRKLPMSTKQDLVKCFVHYHAQHFRNKFIGIGNIFERPREWIASKRSLKIDSTLNTKQVPPESGKSDFVLERTVSLPFFWGNHLTQDVPRGPFANSHDWLHARLSFVLNDQERILKESDDEDDIEDAESAKNLTQRLLELLPWAFPSTGISAEPSVLFHDDMSWQNILVDEVGKITAVIDWECVSALPLWRSCRIPAFLEGRERDEEPRRDQYPMAESEDEENSETGEDGLDNEGVNNLYWEHLLEYEQTQLRRLFINEMEKLEPSWVEELRKGEFKADFEEAVHNCDNGFCFKIIRAWLDALDNGESWSLRRRLLM